MGRRWLWIVPVLLVALGLGWGIARLAGDARAGDPQAAAPGAPLSLGAGMPSPAGGSAERDARAPARMVPGRSAITARGRDRGRPRPLTLDLALSRPVPYRVRFLDAPPRLVVDFRGLEVTPGDADATPGRGLLRDLRAGPFRPGWSRLVAELPGPYALREAVIAPDPEGPPGAARIRLAIEPVAPEDFEASPNALSALWDLPQPATGTGAAPVPHPAPGAPGGRPLRIAIDPGHGGHDPGAQVGAISEAAVMLGFARELSDLLGGAGFEVVPTRSDDRFVPLEQRMTIARAAGADVLVSLHADALPVGQAAGISFYIWNPQADDRAAGELALRHDRADLLAGLDLGDADDQVAGTLMDLARQQTQPRSEALARFAVAELTRSGIALHSRPVQGAAFSVLKSPDIPSVLVETGFLTDPGDRAHLFDPEWRRAVAGAMARAIAAWAEDDADRAHLARH